jgi:hypothetical protein
VLLELRNSEAGRCAVQLEAAAITRKVGTAAAMARIMTLKPGVVICQLRGLLSLLTITAPAGLPREQQPWLAAVIESDRWIGQFVSKQEHVSYY